MHANWKRRDTAGGQLVVIQRNVRLKTGWLATAKCVQTEFEDGRLGN